MRLHLRLTRRHALAAGLGAAGLGLVGALAFGPVVRGRVAAEAARRHLVVQVGGVRPGWFSVGLVDLSAMPEGVPGAIAHVQEARIHLGLGLHPTAIDLRGVSVELTGAHDSLRRDLARWRAGWPESSGDASRRPPTPIVVESGSLRWQDGEHDGAFVQLRGAAMTRDATGLRFAVGDGHARLGAADISIAGLAGELDAAGSLSRARASSLGVQWTPPSPPPPPPPAAPTEKAPEPAPAPVAARPIHPKKKTRHDDSPALDVTEAWFPLPDLHALRARVALVASVLAERIPEGADIGVDALTWKLARPGEAVALAVGPGPLTVSKTPATIQVHFSTDPEKVSTPLALDAALPLDASDVRFTLQGGPASLAWIGVEEGAAGLVDVARATVTGQATVVLAGDGNSVTFDGEGLTRGLSVSNARLASDVVRGLDLEVRARGILTAAGDLRFDDLGANLGAIRLSAAGSLEQEPHHVEAAFRFDVPTLPCQSMLDSVPAALLPVLAGTTIGGTFGARGRFSFDTRSLDDLDLSYAVEDRCRMLAVPQVLARERYKRPFQHPIRMPDGSTAEQTTGPGTPRWTPLERISPYMQIAVLTTEDGGFPHHHGFNHASIRASLIANIKARRFVRGASTISMQVAKNLFLSREKTLSRKLEEVVLTDYLEQAFSKDELMELYLNVIEFGPAIYGITDAADHYFGRTPAELDLAECLFLSSLLPAPLRYGAMRERGEIPDGWMQTLHNLMQVAHRNGLITDAELSEGEGETVVFWRGGARPDPRPAVHARSRFDSDSDAVDPLPVIDDPADPR